MVAAVLTLGFLPLQVFGQGPLVAAVEDIPDSPGALAGNDGPATGSVSGTVKDSNGALIVGAKVGLSGKVAQGGRETVSGPDGGFRFDGLAPGGFTVTVNASGLATWVTSGTVHVGEAVEVPRIGMTVSSAFANVTVLAGKEEIAAAQVSLEEKQRVLGVFPNFYATYIWNAAPLTSKQKFGLAWRSVTDPVSFGLTGVVAGIEQSQNDYAGYGQGAQGYGKRYGASYADGFLSTMIGGAILPSLLHQDPRYFYKGTGSIRSRAGYAIAAVVICKGDNGKWQPNYSNVLGNLATSGISNIYYPASDRNGARLTIDNALIGTAEGAAANLIQEFLIRRLTPHIPDYGPSKKQ